jgi:hypothetical protein
MKYRIVSRNKSPYNNSTIDYLYYYAQFKVFGKWIDCRHNPFNDGEYDYYNIELEVVERWVNCQRQCSPLKEEVVKTYD